MVLTPQLRQRIEMLQMTTVELSELIQNEMVANPVLEEVQTEEEFEEISEKILDQNSDGNDESYENRTERDYSVDVEQAENYTAELPNENGSSEDGTSDFEGEEFSIDKSDAFEEVDYGREFQDYLDPGYKTQEIEFKEDAPSFDQFLSRSATLNQHLEWQLNLQQISEALEEAAVCVVGNLTKTGD
jgi:RNA polymerase sigma-54 factor